METINSIVRNGKTIFPLTISGSEGNIALLIKVIEKATKICEDK